MKALIPSEIIEKKILLIRGEKVMLDADLADLYEVETKMLVRAVKRNIDRFPADFMIQLDKVEFENLRCQIGTSSRWEAALRMRTNRRAPGPIGRGGKRGVCAVSITNYTAMTDEKIAAQKEIDCEKLD